MTPALVDSNDPEDPTTAELAGRLLEPLRSYQSVACAAKARPAVAVVVEAKEESGKQSAPADPADPVHPKKPEGRWRTSCALCSVRESSARSSR